jgi:hypothetical protein
MIVQVPRAFHPDFGQVVNYQFEPMPEDADAQVRMTVKRVLGHIQRDSLHPLVQEQAQDALALGAGDPVAGVFGRVKQLMRFRQDADIADDLQVADRRKGSTVETIIRPLDQAVLIAGRGVGVGDCDCYCGYAGALLTALGVPIALVTVAANPKAPRSYSHVYIAAYPYGPESRVALDTSHGQFPGWECPNLGRKREWTFADADSAGAVLGFTLAIVAMYGAAKWYRKGAAA